MFRQRRHFSPQKASVYAGFQGSRLCRQGVYTFIPVFVFLMFTVPYLTLFLLTKKEKVGVLH